MPTSTTRPRQRLLHAQVGDCPRRSPCFLLPAPLPSPRRSKRFPAAPALLPCFQRAREDCLRPCRHLPTPPAPAADQGSIPLLPARMHDAPAIATGGCGRWATLQHVQHLDLQHMSENS
jgi:hypothetical protein